MNWKKGQRIVALYYIVRMDRKGNKPPELIIMRDQSYKIKEIGEGCCNKLLDVGKTNNEKNILVYTCEKCSKVHHFKENEKILFNEHWFKPIDPFETESEKKLNRLKALTDDKFGEMIQYISIPVEEPKKALKPFPKEEELA